MNFIYVAPIDKEEADIIRGIVKRGDAATIIRMFEQSRKAHNQSMASVEKWLMEIQDDAQLLIPKLKTRQEQAKADFAQIAAYGFTNQSARSRHVKHMTYMHIVGFTDDEVLESTRTLYKKDVENKEHGTIERQLRMAKKRVKEAGLIENFDGIPELRKQLAKEYIENCKKQD